MKYQRAAAARAAHDKTGLDNVKADAAEVGVDGREPGAGYSQSYQCGTNGGRPLHKKIPLGFGPPSLEAKVSQQAPQPRSVLRTKACGFFLWQPLPQSPLQ